MRVVDKKEARGSLKWIRKLINEYPNLLNEIICNDYNLHGSTGIEWVSPLKEDEYAEYRDGAFLDLLDIQLEHRALVDFWPKMGPQWDALGRTNDGNIFLLEAKANIPEIVTAGTGASRNSKKLIEQSLRETQIFMNVSIDIPWSGKLYQYTNRLAHLYLLRELNGIDAYLISVYFIGDEEVNGPSTKAEWLGALTVVKGVLGIENNHALSPYCLDVFINVKSISN